MTLMLEIQIEVVVEPTIEENLSDADFATELKFCNLKHYVKVDKYSF